MAIRGLCVINHFSYFVGQRTWNDENINSKKTNATILTGATTENVVQQTTEMKPGVIGTSPSLTDRFNSLDGRVATLEKTLGSFYMYFK